MSSTAELVKEKLDIVDVVKGYMPLTPAGKNLKGLCPFHKEKTPSFIVSPDRESWHCFGCNEGGDLISFVMKYEHLEFIEALKVLAEKAGIDIKLVGGRDERQYAVLYEIQDAAKRFFESALAAPTSQAEAARAYLVSRKLTPETIKEFELGFAPPSSDALTRHLLKSGYALDDVVRAGLVYKTERGTHWDRFRGRIMFPLANPFGKTVAFTGRVLPGGEVEGVGKYVNSPETPIFSKSKLLFGYHKSKAAIRDTKTAVLVEGQMDFLMVWQDGVRNAIATSGTALTREHLRALRRAADTLVLGFDTDAAGQLAIERTIDLASAEDFSLKVFGVASDAGGYKDPADMVVSHPGLVAELIASARPAMHYFFDRYLPQTAGDVREMKQGIRAILTRVKAIASPVERAHWIQDLSRRTGMGETVLHDEMDRLLITAKKNVSEDAAAPEEREAPRSRHERIAERILTLAASKPEWASAFRGEHRLFPASYRAMAASLAGEGEALSEEEDAALARLHMRAGLEADLQKTEFDSLLRELKNEHHRLAREALAVRIHRAEAEGNDVVLKEALQEFDTLTRTIHNG